MMNEYVENYVREMTIENVKNLFLNGCSLELAIKVFDKLPEELINNIYEEVMKNK